jgi:hypothetical protein
VPLWKWVCDEARKSLSKQACRRARSTTPGEFTVTIGKAVGAPRV